MIRNPYGHSSKNPRRPHFPVPEDIFASEDQVAERHERDIRSPAIDQAIDDWNVAKEEGDENGLRSAAKSIVDATSAAFRLQGVPLYAHPVLPPQFVAAEATSIARLPQDRQRTAVAALLDKFDPSVKPGGTQQFARHIAPPDSSITRSYRPAQTNMGVLHHSGGNAPSYSRQLPPPTPSYTPHRNGFDPLERAPTWAPEQTAQERAAPRPASPPPPIVHRTWDEELAARSQSGTRQNAFEEWGETFWSYLGYPISPDEKLRRQKARELEAEGRRPMYFGPRDPLPDDPYKDRVAWPVKPEPGKPDVVVVSPWGKRTLPSGDEFHPGVDFRNRKDRPAFSPLNGTILRIERNAGGGGNQIFILNDDGSIVGFAHTGALDGLQEGDEVYAGQLIGMSDGSGGTPAKPPVPHTHISYYPPGTPVDPRTRKPMQGPNPHDLSTKARTQSNPLEGLRMSRPPRRLTPEGHTGQTPMRVDRGQ